jgi:ADP-ribosyl-[dinitrogen reductase] hydrolase
MMTDQNRARGALLGLAVGDALGVPLEFTQRDTHPQVTDMIGGGVFNLAPGEWTDDTSMALCLSDSLLINSPFDQRDFLARLVCWWKSGEYAVNGACFDIGCQTRDALVKFMTKGALLANDDPDRAGNGSLIRLAPVAIRAAADLPLAIELAAAQSACTHNSPLCLAACRYFVEVLVEALQGAGKDAFKPRALPWAGNGQIAAIAGGSWRDKPRLQISSSGYVVHTLEAALWAVGNASTFEEALILAVNLGDDADSVGAVAGQLAGAMWGAESIPLRWFEPLAWRAEIESLADRLACCSVG